ncbi:SPX-domain-containing protein, partial [Pilatotrama ljubarskyi]
MKFARYLEETQTPEWKKAYIDYRGLKKRITAIRRAHQAAAGIGKDGGSSSLLPLPRFSTSHGSEANGRPPSRRSLNITSTMNDLRDSATSSSTPRVESAHTLGVNLGTGPDAPAVIPGDPNEFHSDPGHAGHESKRPDPGPRSTTVEPSALPKTRGRSTTVTGMLGRAFSAQHPQRTNSQRGSAGFDYERPRFDLRHPIPLMELLPQLTPVERAFFDKLDEELDKVESFYCEREREMRHRGNLLKEQLQELQDHRRAFYEAHPIAATPYSWLPLPLTTPIIPNILIRRRKARQARPSYQKGTKTRKQSPGTHSDGSEEGRVISGTDTVIEPEMPKAAVKQMESGSGEEETTKDGQSSPEGSVSRSKWRTTGAAKSVQALFHFRPGPVSADVQKKGTEMDAEVDGDKGESSSSPTRNGSTGGAALRYDPEEYQHAKKQLKKAVLECYRGLELLNNYRTLNLIGFRKALKKFEKVTHIPAQQAYTKEKIEPSAFSSGATVDSLIRDMEALFAARFARGDKKKALARLRGGTKHTSHHFSTFRTGMCVGLAVPALADGLYRSRSTSIAVLTHALTLHALLSRFPPGDTSRDPRLGRSDVHIRCLLHPYI